MSNTQHIAIGGAVLAFEVLGVGRPRLVFLHEGLGSVELWRSFPQEVVDGTGEAALVYDRRGHGRSTASTEQRTVRYLHDSALDELAALLDQTDITDPILIGHSDGATIALLYAAHRSVAGLVLIAPHVYVEQAATKGIERTDRDAEVLIRRLERYHDHARDLYTAWRDIWLDAGFAEWDITREIRAIDVPVLLIQGSSDEYGTLDQLDRIEAAVSGPVARMVIESAGHSPHLSHSDETVSAVIGFVRAITDGDGDPPPTE